VSRPRLARTAALGLGAALALAGCGKSNLPHPGAAASASEARAADRAKATPAPAASPPVPVAIPLKLTAVRAAAFAQAVNLQAVDVPGSHRSKRVATIESRQEENEQCSHDESAAIGGGRSERLERGSELEAETISSSVIVMRTPSAARTDLAYAESTAGLKCYTMLLARKLKRESNATVAVGRVRVTRLKVVPAAGQSASGIRISAQVAGVKSGLSLNLYVDALAFQYGPAEVELYATSFVQPVASRTEQELLALMHARAGLSAL
jgi:hypothetical protein